MEDPSSVPKGELAARHGRATKMHCMQSCPVRSANKGKMEKMSPLTSNLTCYLQQWGVNNIWAER